MRLHAAEARGHGSDVAGTPDFGQTENGSFRASVTRGPGKRCPSMTRHSVFVFVPPKNTMIGGGTRLAGGL